MHLARSPRRGSSSSGSSPAVPGRGRASPLSDDRSVSERVASFIDAELDAEEAETRHMSTSRAIGGAVLMVVVVAIEVGISELVKHQSTGDSRYNAPYLITYINHGTTGVACFAAGSAILRLQGRSLRHALAATGFFSWKAAAATAAWMGVLYKYNAFWAAAMSVTSVAVFYSISQSYCVIVFLLSVALLGERVTPFKVVSVCFCVGGVLLISLAPDSGDNTSTRVMGIVYTLIFTLGQAIFTVLWGHFLHGADVATVFLFLGLMGMSSIVLCWPPLPLLQWWGVEDLPVPTATQAGLIALVAATAVANNFTLMLALSVTTPLFVSIGKVLQIPMSAAADRILHSETPAPLAMAGMAAVLLGFLIMTVERSITADRGHRGYSGAPDGQPGSEHSLELDPKFLRTP
eukprot:TRINITY_DN9160_c0_g1_i2.p1 TRINITY_DN9160_c0_g1~~TRINITY_DN9160_c0_g1_i2.p1  ORF type:complete len:441 (+),score=126.69 TRINITY_DN9160_c0_g1_i2:111-1325(+)